MPIKVLKDLPAKKVLENENIFVMDNARAMSQDIRPLQIIILNLMPTKEKTEEQLLRLLSNSPLQIDITLLTMESYNSKNTSKEHLNSFYKVFKDIKAKKFDGLIITGAPVEKLDYEEVEYWKELSEIMEWAKVNVYSTFHICWGAQAGLYYNYGINKELLNEKMSGIFKHTIVDNKIPLVRGFDHEFLVPHSRNTTVNIEEFEKIDDLIVISTSKEAGVYLAMSKDGRRIFVSGHSEYDCDTLKKEYDRDMEKGINPKIPVNYFPEDDPRKEPISTWKSHAHLLYSNWLNYYVYQRTPFNINEI
ncbi:MAG: homoserine O-succinyltransferase [Fusobacterium sp. JB021]|nr:homoserine O-succinyltransferase [Fusobacterium sp. JB020]MDP0492830.1 homoserine O-succinyltransferase [Fusobacterium sp. JB021]MDP0506952.1 homoserine O-succinyltransferase [Fusobacterium sp. JB019]